MSHQNFRVLKDTFAPYSNYLPYKKLAVLTATSKPKPKNNIIIIIIITRGGRVDFAKMGYLGRFWW